MKYFKPKSSTWWSGIAAIAYGIYTKDVQMVLGGFAAIGIRAKMGD